MIMVNNMGYFTLLFGERQKKDCMNNFSFTPPGFIELNRTFSDFDAAQSLDRDAIERYYGDYLHGGTTWERLWRPGMQRNAAVYICHRRPYRGQARDHSNLI